MESDASIFPEKRAQFIVKTLLCLMPILGMAVDLVAPSLPAIADTLHASSSAAKNVITFYLLGYGLGNFFSGCLTDSLGRQRLLRLGMASFILASLAPVVFPHIGVLLTARFVQGLSIGTVAVVSRAIFSDILSPEKLIRSGILIGSMFGLGTVVGPLIGGYLQFYFGWQSCFVFFTGFMLVAFVPIFFFIPETLFKPRHLNVNILQSNLIEITTHKKFMAMVISMGCVYALVITFNTIGPFIIQVKMNYSAVFFGNMALCMGLSYLLATSVCRYLLKYFSVEKLFLIFINSFFVISVFSFVLSYFYNKNIILIAISSACMFFACGSVFPMSMGKGLALFRHMAGTSSATMYLINILMTSLIGFSLSLINFNSALSLMFVYVVLMGVCMIVYWKMIHNKV